MKCYKQFLDWLFPSFVKKHYRCAVCGVLSASPDNICFPVEQEFEE